MPLSPGTRLGPYEISAQLGAGGMGEVYKATDTRLGRTVAVKTLHSTHVARFEREARAIASLNHPHICQLYDVGADFLVMEYIEGSPLLPEHHSKDRTETLPVAVALRYATQVAEALEAAHAKGITHRDLKPANILVTSTGVKLLDFGLAKLDHMPMGGEETVLVENTLAGTILGTAAYMSPEQAEGKAADARSDIFSFGAVFYEMLAGHRAFTGNSAVATMGAIVYKNPEPFEAPPALEAIVLKCLSKNPVARYQTASDLRKALEHGAETLGLSATQTASVSLRPVSGGLPGTALARASAGAAAAGTAVAKILNESGISGPATVEWTGQRLPLRVPPSIAVLPFANMSREPENEYFSDGLAEELIGALSQISGLKVIARTSAFAFKGKNEDVRKIADTLGVTNVLEGSVRRSGNRVRVSAQLIQATDGTQLWAQRYDREMTDVFAIQDELSQAIAEQLKVSLRGIAGVHRQTANVEAYEAVLQGRHELYRFTLPSLDVAKQCLERAIVLDPEYAFAHASLAEYYIQLAISGTAPPRQMFPLAEQAAQRALELDPSVVEAHAALGLVSAAGEYDWAASDRHYLRAIELNPAAASTHFSRGYWCLRPSGRLEEARVEIDRALDLDPLCLHYRFGKAFLALSVGNDDEAAAGAQLTFDLDPTYLLGYFVLSHVRAGQGRLEEAIVLAERMVEIHGRWSTTLMVLGAVYGLSGRRKAAEAILHELEEQWASSESSAAAPCIVNSVLGHMDQAFLWAERAIEQRDMQMLSIKTGPAFALLRKDPRATPLLASMNLA